MSERICKLVVMAADGVTPQICGGEIKEDGYGNEISASLKGALLFGICQSCNVMFGPPFRQKQIVVYEIADDYKADKHDQVMD